MSLGHAPRLRALRTAADSELGAPPIEAPPRRGQRARVVLCGVALLAVLCAGELAAMGVRAQIDARLRAAGAGANAGVVAIESEQLALVREATYTAGVVAALESRDVARLNATVTPLQANSGVPMLDVVYPNGQVVLAVRSKGAPQPVASRRGLSALRRAVRTASGRNGGRFSTLAMLQGAPVLLTAGPLRAGDDIVGVLLAMNPLADVLGRLAGEVNVTLTAFAASGEPIATTSAGDPAPLDPSTAAGLVTGGRVVVRAGGAGREMLGRLVLDHRSEAVLGASLGDDAWLTELLVDVAAGLGALALAGAGTLRRRHGRGTR